MGLVYEEAVDRPGDLATLLARAAGSKMESMTSMKATLARSDMVLLTLTLLPSSWFVWDRGLLKDEVDSCAPATGTRSLTPAGDSGFSRFSGDVPFRGGVAAKAATAQAPHSGISKPREAGTVAAGAGGGGGRGKPSASMLTPTSSVEAESTALLLLAVDAVRVFIGIGTVTVLGIGIGMVFVIARRCCLARGSVL